MGFRAKGELLDGWMDGRIPIRLYCIRAPVVLILIKLLTGEKTRSGNEQLCQDLRLFSIWQGVRFSWRIWHTMHKKQSRYFILMVRGIVFRLLVSAKTLSYSGSDTLWSIIHYSTLTMIIMMRVKIVLVSVSNNSENEDDATIVGDKKIDFYRTQVRS